MPSDPIRLPTDNEASEVLRYIEDICTDRIMGFHLFGTALAGRINAVISDYWAGNDWKGNDRG